MYLVINKCVYFNIRNTLPKSGTFLLGHTVYCPKKSSYFVLKWMVQIVTAVTKANRNTRRTILIKRMVNKHTGSRTTSHYKWLCRTVRSVFSNICVFKC